MARKFLYAIVVIFLLIVAALLALRFWAGALSELAFVPSAKYQTQAPLAATIYEDPAMWLSRPGKGAADPARWLPDGAARANTPLNAAVFFIHPTSYLAKDQWNAPLNDKQANDRTAIFVRANATPFNASVELWAPRYRQAALGAFLTGQPEAVQALDAAYRDVLQAFDYFIASTDRSVPIVLVGHSQGSVHLKRLLMDRVAGTPLAKRVVAAYVIGWPVSLDHDLPRMGLPACAAPGQTGCVISWLSVAEPADTEIMSQAYSRRKALDGQSPGGSPFLCSNPLTGGVGGDAPASANLGTMVPDLKLTTARLVPGMVPASCRPDGFLNVGAPPQLGPYVLPGNNYHVYDVPLFWANLRADVTRRAAAWKP